MAPKFQGIAALAATLLVAPIASAQTGPISYWRFDEGAGAVALDSVGTNPGLISGEAAFVPGMAGSALRFDAQDDFVTFQQTFLFNRPGDATMLLWVQREDDAHRTIVWGRDGGDDPDVNRFHFFSGWLGPLSCFDGQYGYGFDYRDERSDVGDANIHRLPCAAGITPGQWVHLALVREGSTYRVYVNGTLANTLEDAEPMLPSYEGWWTLGLRNDGMSFLGAMDELALYGRALAADEIAARYERTLRGQGYEGPPPAGATCTRWNLAGDFRAPPRQANPSPDACGAPAWSYLHAPPGSLDAAERVPMADFQQDWSASTGRVVGWNDAGLADCGGDPCLPIVGFNVSGGVLLQPWWAPFPWYGATVVVHPGPTRAAVVAFEVPFTGELRIDSLRVGHLDPWGGTGVDWTLDLAGRQVAGGLAWYYGGPGLFQGTLAVKAGETLAVTIGPNGDYSFDTTQLDVALRMARIEVAVDVRPGSASNPVKLSVPALLPAAVLGSPVLDAASVDPGTLILAGAPVARLPDGRPQASLQDVDGDGRLDLVAQFPVRALRLGPTATAAALTGALRDGTAIHGQDAVRVLP